MATTKDLERADRKLYEIEIPEKYKTMGVTITPEAMQKLTEHPFNRVTIYADEYADLIRISERYKLIENYILNNEFCSADTLRAMVGYAGEE